MIWGGRQQDARETRAEARGRRRGRRLNQRERPDCHVAKNAPRKDGRWNDREPKYDIREWSPDGQTMSKGVTLSKEELAVLKELLNKMEV